jgi:hypothetical protein
MAKEKRIFIVDPDLVIDDLTRKSIAKLTKTEVDIEIFMTEAERQGTVFSLPGFQQAFNECALTREPTLMLIADVDTSNPKEVTVHELDGLFFLAEESGQTVEGGFKTELEAEIYAKNNGFRVVSWFNF